MMNDSEVQHLIRSFFDRFGASDIDGVLALLTPDASWRMMGQQGGIPISGTMDRDGIVGLMENVRKSVKGGIKAETREWTIQYPRAAVEVESHAELNNGRLYNNLYHYVFIIKDQKIQTIREYGDTDQVRRVFIDP